jgi:hypothetical protein
MISLEKRTALILSEITNNKCRALSSMPYKSFDESYRGRIWDHCLEYVMQQPEDYGETRSRLRDVISVDRSLYQAFEQQVAGIVGDRLQQELKLFFSTANDKQYNAILLTSEYALFFKLVRSIHATLNKILNEFTIAEFYLDTKPPRDTHQTSISRLLRGTSTYTDFLKRKGLAVTQSMIYMSESLMDSGILGGSTFDLVKKISVLMLIRSNPLVRSVAFGTNAAISTLAVPALIKALVWSGAMEKIRNTLTLSVNSHLCETFIQRLKLLQKALENYEEEFMEISERLQHSADEFEEDEIARQMIQKMKGFDINSFLADDTKDDDEFMVI